MEYIPLFKSSIITQDRRDPGKYDKFMPLHSNA